MAALPRFIASCTFGDLSYVRQEPSRVYALAPRLIRLGELRRDVQRVGASHMERLVDELGKSANLATLDGDQIVYLAQAQSRY
jgi:IclR family transcriptional regulator, acetate operon repressor